jgi:hypothetical protein
MRFIIDKSALEKKIADAANAIAEAGSDALINQTDVEDLHSLVSGWVKFGSEIVETLDKVTLMQEKPN